MIAPFRTKRANFGHSDKKVGVCNCLGECNRYASIVRPQYFNVTGQRASGSIILVNGGPPSYQQGSSGLYFRKEVAANASGRYTATTVTANSVTTDAWNQYVAPNPEPYTYDADGNLLTDGRWIYTWDAENRLTSATSQPQSSPPLAVNGVRAEFTYDGLSRRIEKRTYQNSSIAPSWVLNNWELYAYDGWNLVTTARRNNDASVVRRVGVYCWGPDLGSAPLGSTTWQAAGGVGGFLFSVDYTNAAVTYTGLAAPPADPTDDHYFACQDRLGNITGIMRATSGQTALESVLDYDPFGREIRATGTAARRLPFHFSSKFTDSETGLVYFGYRFYDPRNGRWLNRDPIGEMGGLNVYAMIKNNAAGFADRLGLDIVLMEGNTGAESSQSGNRELHQEICIDQWVGCEKRNMGCEAGHLGYPRPNGRRCFSFSACGVGWSVPSRTWLNRPTWWNLGGPLQGVVYEAYDTGSKELSRKKTTCEEDMAFIKQLLAMVDTKDAYSVAHHNCRLFAQTMFGEAPGHEAPAPAPPPPPAPSAGQAPTGSLPGPNGPIPIRIGY